MIEERKKSGLQKDISSIFAGLEDIDNGRTDRPSLVKEEVPSQPEISESLSSAENKISPEDPSPLPALVTNSEAGLKAGKFSRHKNSFLGLDFGSYSVKLIQLSPVSDGWEIKGYAIQEFNEGKGEQGIIERENFARHLKEVLNAAGISNGMVVCSLRGEDVNTSLIQLARMPKSELLSASRLEAGRRVTFDIDKAFIHNIVVEKDQSRPGGKMNYIITAVSREIVKKILGILRQARLQVIALIPIPFAWKDFLQLLFDRDGSPVVAVIDIGALRTQVSIYKGGQLYFSRKFDTGGRDVTEAVIQAGQTFGVKKSISWEEAEKIKISNNLLQADSMKLVKDNLTASQVAGMVRPVVEKIAQESKRSLDYFRQLYRKYEVDRVYMCGGGALLMGLQKFFQDKIRPPIELLGIPHGIKLDKSIDTDEIRKIFPRLARATALSMSRKWEINFVPQFDKIIQNILRRKMLILVPILAVFLVSFLFYRSKVSLIPHQEIILKSKMEQIEELESQLTPYQVLANLKKQLVAREKVGLISSIRQPNWKGVLKEFSRITPSSIILSRINSLEGEVPFRILCSGQVLARDMSLSSGITQFIVEVENSPFFKDVEKIYEDIDRGTFSFSCTLIY